MAKKVVFRGVSSSLNQQWEGIQFLSGSEGSSIVGSTIMDAHVGISFRDAKLGINISNNTFIKCQSAFYSTDLSCEPFTQTNRTNLFYPNVQSCRKKSYSLEGIRGNRDKHGREEDGH